MGFPVFASWWIMVPIFGLLYSKSYKLSAVMRQVVFGVIRGALKLNFKWEEGLVRTRSKVYDG